MNEVENENRSISSSQAKDIQREMLEMSSDESDTHHSPRVMASSPVCKCVQEQLTVIKGTDGQGLSPFDMCPFCETKGVTCTIGKHNRKR